jgi:hypothetical protein
VEDTNSVYTKACNIVDMINDRWALSENLNDDGGLTSLAYGALVRQIANDIRKLEMYQSNLAFVRRLAQEDSDVSLSLEGELPEDWSDLFDVFDEEEKPD